MVYLALGILPMPVNGVFGMKNIIYTHAVIASLLISILHIQSAIAESKGVAYVSNQDGGVSVVDLDSLEIKSTYDPQAKGPRGIGITQDGSILVTANKEDGNISLIDTRTGKLIKHISVGKNPEFVRVSGETAYVTYEPSSSLNAGKKGAAAAKDGEDDDKTPGHIAIVDLKLGKVLQDLVGKPETEGVEISKDGRKIFVTNESDNSITILDSKSGKQIKNISIAKYGERPRGIKISPDGSLTVTTLELSNKLLVLNDKFEVIKEIQTGKAPYGVAFNHEGTKIFVAANKDKILQVFDAKTFEKIKDIQTGDRCWHFSFSPDEQHIMLACGKSNELIFMDAKKLEITKRLSGLNTPWGVVTYPKTMGSIDRP